MKLSAIRRCWMILPLLAPTVAMAAPVAAPTPATAKGTVLHPLSLVKTADLDFGRIIVTGAGTVVINPVSDTQATTGGVVASGGAPHSAAYVGASSGLSLIFVQQPTAAVVLTRAGGTETMTATNFTLQNGNFYISFATGAFAFRLGATLNVAAGQAEGVYTGTFNVDATYF